MEAGRLRWKGHCEVGPLGENPCDLDFSGKGPEETRWRLRDTGPGAEEGRSGEALTLPTVVFSDLTAPHIDFRGCLGSSVWPDNLTSCKKLAIRVPLFIKGIWSWESGSVRMRT